MRGCENLEDFVPSSSSGDTSSCERHFQLTRPGPFITHFAITFSFCQVTWVNLTHKSIRLTWCAPCTITWECAFWWSTEIFFQQKSVGVKLNKYYAIVPPPVLPDRRFNGQIWAKLAIFDPLWLFPFIFGYFPDLAKCLAILRFLWMTHNFPLHITYFTKNQPNFSKKMANS